MFWGDAGLGMAIMGSGLAAAGIAALIKAVNTQKNMAKYRLINCVYAVNT